MDFNTFKTEFLWYIDTVTNEMSHAGMIRKAVDYYNSLDTQTKTAFINKAYDFIHDYTTLYAIIIQTATIFQQKGGKMT